MDYPIFSPPIELASKEPREWSKSEAEAYFSWFLSNAGPRVDGLLGYLGLSDVKQPAILLAKAQEKLEQLFISDQFVADLPEGRKLTNRGYALAADMGLLVAHLLIAQGKGSVFWEILKKPKTDQSFNLPVLIGFDKVHVDPIAVSIADAAWIARGNKKHEAWLKVFNFLVEKIT